MAATPNGDPDDIKMPLLEHLGELRRRLLYSLGAILLLFMVCYAVSDRIFAFLVQPLADVMATHGIEGRRLIFTALHEAFFTYIKVSFFAALFLAFPFVAIQVWRFVAPGLYDNEKRAFLPFLIMTPVLFFLGGALVYYFIFPLAWQFFLSFESSGGPEALPIQLEAKVDQYLSLVMRLIFAFGLSFELPVVMMILGRMNMVTAKGLAEKRRYAIVITFIAAALLTPPDVISQVGLAIPILALYELSIVLVRMAEKKRALADEELAEESDDENDDEDSAVMAEEDEDHSEAPAPRPTP